MTNLIIVCGVHYIICFILFFITLIRKKNDEYINFFIAFAVPVWGLVFLLCKKYSDRNIERKSQIDLQNGIVGRKPNTIGDNNDVKNAVHESVEDTLKSTYGDEEQTIFSRISQSVVIDDDEMKDSIVPLEEALVVNDTATKRALIMDVLYSNPGDYVPQLFYAKSNGDTEVVHYAATALTEIQKDFDLKLKDIIMRKQQNPDDQELNKEHISLLEKYISSMLLSGDRLKNLLRQYSQMIKQELGKDDIKGRWKLINKKAEADLELEDIEALDEDISYMLERWPEREGVYVFKMQRAVLKKDKKIIDETIKQIRDREIHITSELRSLIDFWNEDL